MLTLRCNSAGRIFAMVSRFLIQSIITFWTNFKIYLMLAVIVFASLASPTVNALSDLFASYAVLLFPYCRLLINWDSILNGEYFHSRVKKSTQFEFNVLRFRIYSLSDWKMSILPRLVKVCFNDPIQEADRIFWSQQSSCKYPCKSVVNLTDPNFVVKGDTCR